MKIYSRVYLIGYRFVTYEVAVSYVKYMKDEGEHVRLSDLAV